MKNGPFLKPELPEQFFMRDFFTGVFLKRI